MRKYIMQPTETLIDFYTKTFQIEINIIADAMQNKII